VDGVVPVDVDQPLHDLPEDAPRYVRVHGPVAVAVQHLGTSAHHQHIAGVQSPQLRKDDNGRNNV
jgi:hypothetical protein